MLEVVGHCRVFEVQLLPDFKLKVVGDGNLSNLLLKLWLIEWVLKLFLIVIDVRPH